ncbi:MAG TPA: glycosyl transferase family 1, partial [Anaerolineales bacterium]|nr:glycosyl transferase family 1 [Anaerolineales bacterium]
MGADGAGDVGSLRAGDRLMEVLHIYKDYYPALGGIENHIKVLAEAQAGAGHRVTVLVCDPGPRTRVEELHGVRVVKAGRLTTAASMPLSISQPLGLARLRPDIAHVHSPYPLGEVANWLLGRARATIITHHSDVVRQRGWLRLYGPLLHRVLAAADRVIATSPRYIETSPWLRPVREKCVVVPLGVDHRRFA